MSDSSPATPGHVSPFESIRRTSEEGHEYWSARDLADVLAYTQWRNFKYAIEKAMMVCEASGQPVPNHFTAALFSASIGSGAQREVEDFHLTRYALHLIIIFGDVQKPEIIQALVSLTMISLDGSIGQTSLSRNLSGASLPARFTTAKEVRTIGQITRAFKHLSSVRQYRVTPYFIDLYFPDQKIAVECDERGHRTYDQQAEAQRQQYIEQALQCMFVRYNPDEPDFNVGDVINQIMLLVCPQNP